jgi:hypothetical protein
MLRPMTSETKWKIRDTNTDARSYSCMLYFRKGTNDDKVLLSRPFRFSFFFHNIYEAASIPMTPEGVVRFLFAEEVESDVCTGSSTVLLLALGREEL